ncbi:MAG: hypothetical protein ABIA21_02825 [Candidatus Aenigmatarchaeota archaeon]
MQSGGKENGRKSSKGLRALALPVVLASYFILSGCGRGGGGVAYDPATDRETYTKNVKAFASLITGPGVYYLTLPYEEITGKKDRDGKCTLPNFASGTIYIESPAGSGTRKSMIEVLNDIIGPAVNRDITKYLEQWSDCVFASDGSNVEIAGPDNGQDPTRYGVNLSYDSPYSKLIFVLNTVNGLKNSPSGGADLTVSREENLRDAMRQYVEQFFLLEDKNGKFVNEDIFKKGLSRYQPKDNTAMPITSDEDLLKKNQDERTRQKESNAIFQNKQSVRFNNYRNK